MLHYEHRNLLEVEHGIIAHGCNYVGVMGAGVAKLIKEKFPKAFLDYARYLNEQFERSEALGQCQISKVGLPDQQLYIANCFTQGLAAYDGVLATPDAIYNSLGKAFEHARGLQLPLYIPKIGAGLGGLDWERDVEPKILELCTLYEDVDTYVCVWP